MNRSWPLAIFLGVLGLACGPAVAQTTGAAPNCCGLAPVHDSPQKSMLGTAVNATASAVYFTGYEGNVSEVYYPTIDTLATSNMEFLVGDTAKTFVDEEKSMTWTVTRPDARSMRWQAVTSSAAHNWQITKTIFADPSQNTLVQQTTFAALNGKSVGNFNLYLLLKPYLNNVAANNSAATVVSGSRTYLVANSNTNAGSFTGTVYSALGSSLAWTLQGGTMMVSSGFYGVNDGWQDLLGGSADKTMSWAYGSATGGNVAQMGWLNTSGNNATSITFTVVLGYGTSQAGAIAAASGTLGETIATQQTAYDNAWHSYAGALSTQGGTADDQYYLSAMTLKSMQDKSNGAMIAGIGTPWGGAEGDSDAGGYHLIWPRDMFKFANALITAGDTASATSAVKWLFNVDQETTNCGTGPYNANGCPGSLYTQAGRFPQNAWVNGTEYWQGTQMDEQAMPIILAYRLGPTVYNPLWTKIKATANYLYATGPWTYQERWEENSGYSPSTIAAEIAGLVDAAQIALANGDTADAATWMNAADYWQQNVQAWTYTTQGCPNTASYCGSTSMYERINTSGAAGGTLPAGWNPSAYPNTGTTINIASGGGTHRAIDIIDGGFLELVRLGVKRPSDPAITASLATYDAIIKQTVNGKSGLVPLQLRCLRRNELRRRIRREFGTWTPVAHLHRRAWQLPGRRVRQRRQRQGLSRVAESLLDPQRLHFRAGVEHQHHAARRCGQRGRMDRDDAARCHGRDADRIHGAPELGHRRVHQPACLDRRQQGGRHPARSLLALRQLRRRAGFRPNRGQRQRHGEHDAGAVRLRGRKHCSARQLEHEPWPAGRSDQLSGLEEQRESHEQHRVPIQVLPEERRRQRDLGVLSGQRQLRQQSRLDDAGIRHPHLERHGQLELRTTGSCRELFSLRE